MEISFLGKFGPKNQNYQFKQKFDAYTNSNTCTNFNGVVHFFVSDLVPFLGKFGTKCEYCLFNAKFASLI